MYVKGEQGFEPSEFVQSLSPAKPDAGDDSEDTTEDSQTETETADDTEDGEDNVTDKKVSKNDDDKKPFHEHPRWKEREETWNKRMEAIKAENDAKIAALEAKISQRKEAYDELTDKDIPDWFGGDLDQYKAYFKSQTELIGKKAEEIANKIVEGHFKQTEERANAQSVAEKEATDYFNSEVERIESDEKLNPTGAPIDKQELLQIAIDNDLVDSQKRWNWKAAYRIYAANHPDNGEQDEETQKQKTQKKNIAALTTRKDSKSDTGTQKTVKNADYFKRNKQW